jgi:subtilisin family serine protease
MKRFGTRKGLVLLAFAVATGLALWGSAAGAAPGSSGWPPAKSAAASRARLPLSNATAKPRALKGVPAKGSYAFLLKLGIAPTGRVFESTLPEGRTAARTAAHEQLVTLRAAESRVIAALPSGTHVLYKMHAILAGVAVSTNVANLPALQRIPGVARVYPIAPKRPSLSYSVHLVKAPQVWQDLGDTGGNSTVAIIDTGIDYTHSDFGGPGTTTAYQNALAADTAAPTFPDPNKILGGFDFAGDNYDASGDSGSTTPSPDPNPLDCNSHGTHVAGIVAGYGENPDGSTFTGDYTTLGSLNASDYQALFKIGPGMAPDAKLYAYKVFGCEGSTNVVAAALDRAADPNQDGSTGDHVDVVNMSLGSDFGSPQDGDSVASNAASALGISVVVAAGNGGDLYDIGGSPGNATRVIGVAASQDAYSQIDTLHATVNGNAKAYGAQRSVAYDWANDPDFAGQQVVKLTDPADASNQDGCDPIATDLTGKVAFLEWTDDDTVRRCGSAARSANAEAAGAVGVILGEDEEVFAAGITGSPDIPVVQVIKSAADEIRTALDAHQPVTADSTTANDFQQLVPANDDKVAGFSSRGIGVAGDLKPDVTGVGASVFSAGMGTGNDGLSDSGTSMATPEVAGLSALVRSQNAGWDPEQVKADIMNTADQDLFTGDTHSGTKYAPGRVGAGRIDAQAALQNPVLAFVTNDPGAVSASFGTLEVTAPTVLTKTIKLENTSGTAETYDTSYDALTTIPGVAYSVSPSQVVVAANSSTTATVTLTIANPALLTKTIDPTVDRLQAGLPREYLADASGRVLFTPQDTSLPTLRVPVYSAPRPASSMTQPASLDMPGGPIQTASLPLSGTGVDQGAGGETIQSIVSGFELQATSGALPDCTVSVTTGCIHAGDERAADLKYVGTTSNAPELQSIGDDPANPNCNPDNQCGLEYFAIGTQGPWQTAASQNEFDVYIDSTGDGVPDTVTFNTRFSGTDILVDETIDLQSGDVVDVELLNDRFGDTDTALLNSDTLVMPVFIPTLGASVGHSRITYGISTFGQFSAAPVDTVGFDSSSNLDGSLSTDLLNPGIAVYGAFNGSGSPLLYADSPTTTLTVRKDAASYTADHGQGVLIVHFHNKVGNKAEVVTLNDTLTVGKSGTGSGSVTSSPAGINCGATCSHAFADGTPVTLTATPATGSSFAGWSGGGCSGTSTCVVTLNESTSVTATFMRIPDTTRPKVTSVRVKANHHKRTAKVTFRGTDPGHGSKGLHFKCKLDKHGFRSCRSPKLYKHLRHGKHTVQVKAIDKAGNVSKPVKRKFKI